MIVVSRRSRWWVAALVLSGAAFAADEIFRDLSSKEALYLSDGPKVAYRGPRGGDPKPLAVVGVEADGGVVKVKFKKSPTVWTLTLAPDRQKLVCEAKGEPRQVFELMTPEKLAALAAAAPDAGPHVLRVISPEEGGASYEPVVEVRGEVSPEAQSITVTAFDPSGARLDVHTLGKFKPGDTTFLYRASKQLGNISIGSNRFLFEAKFADGATAKTELHFSLHEYTGEMAKPVIYLYPTRPTRVAVQVEPPGGVTRSEPPYGSGWTVTALPDGRLVTSTGAHAPYLFWESDLTAAPAPLTEGFAVAREELRAFFDVSLATLGLEGREIADFEDFWLSRMTAHPWYAVRFVPREEIDAAAPLTITPRPDSVIRVLVDFRGSEARPVVRAQTLTPARRSGFAAVEWGGLNYRP